MKATNRAEAWKIADSIFPTDYRKNNILSLNAWYDIYESTALGNNSWISDLGCRLELNIVSDRGNSSESINVWIDDSEERIRRELAAATKALYA